MKQVLQERRTGRVAVVEAPAPVLQARSVLVQNAASLISSGTERAAVEMGRRSLLGRALERPDLVRKVLSVAKSRGIREAVRAVRARLDEQTALGYSCAGTVVEVAPDVTGLLPGDRVACAGFGHASHAEFVSVPKNLTVRIPLDVRFEDASFVAVGAIALHGVRTLDPTIGDTVLVVGLGLVGLLSVQILTAGGARVIGIDLSRDRCAIASSLGAELTLVPDADTVTRVLDVTAGRGADGVLITAATKSNEPLRLAGEAARDRSRVAVVGDVGMDVPRSLYYAKELEIRLSRSYGPGRYDATYEEDGIDYPPGYVPWSEQRNMSEFLRLVQVGRVRVQPLIGATHPVDQAAAAYDNLAAGVFKGGVAIVLTYPSTAAPARRFDLSPHPKPKKAAHGVSFIGAGGFGRGVLIPRFAGSGAALRGVVAQNGASAQTTARLFGFAFASTDINSVLDDAATDIVVVATRHDTHAEFVVRALQAGKHVFVEKPLALSREQLRNVLDTAAGASGVLMVGYNRRFSALSSALKEWINGRGPMAVNCRVNAGQLPADHWTRNRTVGGGRIIGEACHFVDLMQFFTGAEPTALNAVAVPSRDGGTEDTMSFSVRFSEGSIGTVHYMSMGSPALPKERIEVFASNGAAVINDFVSLDFFDAAREHRAQSGRQDKGHSEEVARFLASCARGEALIPLRSLALTSLATFGVEEAVRTGKTVPIHL